MADSRPAGRSRVRAGPEPGRFGVFTALMIIGVIVVSIVAIRLGR
jgi:hypothetical protein